MDAKKLALYLDFANHHENATEEDVRNLCQKVLQYGFHSAFVDPYYIPLVKTLVGGKAAVGTVVSFPLGQESTEIKVASALWAVKNGATELDTSMNVGMFKDHKYDQVLAEMKAIVLAVNKQALVKFIIETGFLTDEEIQKAAQLVLESGADFIKTCSGYGPRGATLHDVELIKPIIGDKIQLKVAGGISTYEQAIGFINAGVNRIGTSKAVEIVTVAPQQANSSVKSSE